MSALERSRQWELSLQVFKEMLGESCTPDYITWNSLMSACESGEQWGWALHLLLEAERLVPCPPPQIYAAFRIF